MIIDEEHRFGVRQKEQLKRLRANVDVPDADCHADSAHSAMSSRKACAISSVIATAPNRRLAVKPCHPHSHGSVREAVAARATSAAAKCFYLYNEVDTIENMRERLAERCRKRAHRRGARPVASERELSR